MTLPVKHANRGFPYVQIVDLYSKPLRLQLSSLADYECVWLGDNHVTRAQMAELLPFLQAFVEHGYCCFEQPIGEHPLLADLRRQEQELRAAYDEN